MNRRNLTSIFVCSLLFLLSIPSFAQDKTDGWPIEQRCAADPTAPPDDWTFNGTIFTQDLDGIRAVNASFPTSYFVTFGSEFMDGAALSPDGRWYAIPGGSTSPATEGSVDLYYHVHEIHLYSTDGQREHRTIPWDMTFRSRLETIQWVDNEHIIYRSGHHYGVQENYKVNVLTGEKTKVDIATVPMFPSTNMSRAFYQDDEAITLYDTLTNETLAQFSDIRLNYLQGYPHWSTDSTRFVAVVTAESDSNIQNPSSQIGVYNHDGTLIDAIPWDAPIYNPNLSSDNAYLKWNSPSRLLVADLNAKTITDYCDFPRYNEVWSPDGRQMAFAYENAVYVLELSSARVYILPYSFSHSKHGYKIQTTTNVVAWGQN